jgi:hypothetical protein
LSKSVSRITAKPSNSFGSEKLLGSSSITFIRLWDRDYTCLVTTGSNLGEKKESIANMFLG